MEKIYTLKDITKLYQEKKIPISKYVVRRLCEDEAINPWSWIKHHRRIAGKFIKISIPESSLKEYFNLKDAHIPIGFISN